MSPNSQDHMAPMGLPGSGDHESESIFAATAKIMRVFKLYSYLYTRARDRDTLCSK